MVLGSRIAALRTQKGWSQAELARRLHISASTVGMYEQGRREPPLDTLVEMARAFGVSVELLVTGNALSREDYRTLNRMEPEHRLSDSLKKLSREELLVLLTAELFGISP